MFLLYSHLYKGLTSFELVLWMQCQCPVDGRTDEKEKVLIPMDFHQWGERMGV